MATDARQDCDPSPLSAASIIKSSDDDFKSLQQTFASLLVSSFPISLLYQSIRSGFSIGDLSPSVYRSNVDILALNAALKRHVQMHPYFKRG